jgi:hypothetical protein
MCFCIIIMTLVYCVVVHHFHYAVIQCGILRDAVLVAGCGALGTLTVSVALVCRDVLPYALGTLLVSVALVCHDVLPGALGTLLVLAALVGCDVHIIN